MNLENLGLTDNQRLRLKQECVNFSNDVDFDYSSVPKDRAKKLVKELRARYDLVGGLDSAHTNAKKSMLDLADKIENKIA